MSKLRELPEAITMVNRDQGRIQTGEMVQWHLVTLKDDKTEREATGYGEGYGGEERAYEQALDLLGHKREKEDG